MAKYLPIHDISTEELQELEEQYSSIPEAVEAIEFLEDNNGDFSATIQEMAQNIAENAKVQISTVAQLVENLDKKCREILADKDVSEDLPDLVNTIVSGSGVAALIASHSTLVPFVPVLGYFAALAVKKGIKEYTKGIQ